MSYHNALAAHYRDVRARLLHPPVRFPNPPPVPPPTAWPTLPAPVADLLTARGEEIAKTIPPVILTPRQRTKRLTVRLILQAVARYYGLPTHELRSARRTRHIVRPRQVAMWLAKRLMLASLPHIGRCIGGRDHTTVLHGVRTIERLRLEDAQLAHDLQRLESELRPEPEEETHGEGEEWPQQEA